MLSLSDIIGIFYKYRRNKYIRSLVDNGLNLGNNVQIVSDFFFDPTHCFLITIGDDCTICPNVRLITHDASTKTFLGYTKIGRIRIGKNCFIGDSVIVLPDVEIGNNTIIGAGSIVSRNIPENSVAVGQPAKIIGQTGAYLEKMKKRAELTGIFGEDYLIKVITEKKKKEVIEAVNNGIQFIV